MSGHFVVLSDLIPDHGPVFDTFRPTREEMQFMWDHGQSALTLLRQQMEHDFWNN